MDDAGRKFGGTSRIFLDGGCLKAELGSASGKVFALPALARRALYRVGPMADMMGIGPRRLHVLFTRELGVPAKRWIRELRFVDGVHYWMEKRDADEVAALLGFNHRREWHREIRCFAEMPWQDFLAALEWRWEGQKPEARSQGARRFSIFYSPRQAPRSPLNAFASRGDPP